MGNLSNALPIQWWAISNKTYNETQFGFVRSKPYIHEWQCDDIIKDQISNEQDPSKEYFFRIKDRVGSEIAVLPYIKTLLQGTLITPTLSISNGGFIGSLSPWTQNGSGIQSAWTWLGAGSIKSDGTSGALSSTKYLRTRRADGYISGWPIGHYLLQMTAIVNHSVGAGAANMSYELVGSDDDGVTNTVLVTQTGGFAIGVSTGIGVTFNTTKYWKSVAIRFYNTALTATVIVNVGTINFPTGGVLPNLYPPRYETLAEYDLEFTGSDEGLCNQYVQFFINNVGGTLDGDTLDMGTLDVIDDANDIYKSDFHFFKTTIPINDYHGSQLISYRQYTNYASLNYPGNGNYFNLRLPCKFFTERTQTIQTSINLTSKTIDTSEFIKFQRWLQIPVLPDYMLRKIELILGHSVKGSLLIDGIEWTRQEAVNRSGPGGDIKYPEQMADVWLTEKNAGVRNII